MSAQPILLASASPRRRQLLEADGWRVIVVPPAIDDAAAPIRERDERRHVESLAWFKAAQVLQETSAAAEEARMSARLLVAADTLCISAGRVLGKPRDAQEARGMIESFIGRSHQVATGVTLVDLRDGARRLFSDVAVVSFGTLDPSLLEEHLARERWRGRAGGYNLGEAVDAGWPITCAGDPTTVMGLPMRMLSPLLRSPELAFAARSERSA